jgi:hypothetical protein
MTLTAGAALFLSGLATPAAASSPAVRVVHPGQSIQSALDAVGAGGTVIVRRGVYRENVEITKDGVTLVGDGADLEAPAVSTPRECSDGGDNPFGLCITGVVGATPAESRPVRNVTVRGMTVGQFPSTGILAFGARNVRLENVRATGGSEYGVLLSNTSGSTIRDSHIVGGQEAGIYIGDSPQARTTISGTDVSGAGLFGIFIRSSSHGRITGNRVGGRCIGISFVPDRPEAGTVDDWLAAHNRVSHNDGVCPPLPGDEANITFAGTGILLAGSSHVSVLANTVTNNRAPGGSTTFARGGIVLTSGTAFGGTPVPTGNLVAGNTVRDNQPVDLNVVDRGRGNRIGVNDCRTSSPAGLCHRTG